MRNKIEKSPVRESLFKRVFGRLAKEEDGFAMEYVIIVLLVAAGVIAVVMVFSDTLRGMFTSATVAGSSTKVEEVEQVGIDREKEKEKIKNNLKKAEEAGKKAGGTGETEDEGSTDSER